MPSRAFPLSEQNYVFLIAIYCVLLLSESCVVLFTDNIGHYNITNLPQGSYRIKVDISGIPQISTYDISITSTDTLFENLNFIVDTIFAKSYGFGIWADTLGIINEVFKINDDFNNDFLINVYPNPMINVTQFEYTLNKTSNIEIELFESTGKKIQTIKTGIEKEGKHTYFIDKVNN